MIIVDTSALLALFNRSEPAHDRVAQAVMGVSESFVVSPYVIAEVDYLVATRHGLEAELVVLAELASGAWSLAHFEAADIETALGVVDRYRGLDIGLADASIVVLAERFSTRQILTLDYRHFDVLRPLSGGAFALLPER